MTAPMCYDINQATHKVAHTPAVNDYRKEFVCPEESMRYAGALEQMVFGKLSRRPFHPTIVEFGTGTGEPVIAALLNSSYLGTVHGYEINPEAAAEANRNIMTYGLSRQYVIHGESFFNQGRTPQADYLIANPPYIPCDPAQRHLLTLPDLCGGLNGNDVTKALLSLGYANLFLEVSSYAHPADTLAHARAAGYVVSDFLITPMSLGIYSRQDIVFERLKQMRAEGTAFFSDAVYLVGSALFSKKSDARDMSAEFLSCMTSFGNDGV